MEELIQDLATSLGSWAYVLVGLLAMAETAAFIGFIAPGEFAIIFGGVLAGEGSLSIVLLIGIVWACAVTGDAIGFMIGRRYGRAIAEKHGHRVRLTEERLRKVEEYFARHGGKTIIIGRWFGFIRPLMPFTAGTSGMPYRSFLPYDVLSAGVWSATFCLLGFIFYRSFTQIADIAGKGSIALAITIGVAIGCFHAVKRLRHPEERRRLAAWIDRQAQRPVFRPLAAVARAAWVALLRPIWRFVLRPVWLAMAPPARFLGDRLTPGELGIELTTLLAVAAVSLYLMVLQINLIESGDTFLTGDLWALHLAHDIQSGALTALAKALSLLGSLWVVPFVVLAVLAYLWSHRQVAEAITLAVGVVVTEIAVQVMKAAVDRPRPADSLVDTQGSAYPSGHAAVAVTYLAIAVLLARGGRPARRVAIVLAGLAAMVLIGLSRVYLRAHYLSDVGGGWALGLAIFSTCGCIALVVQYLRDNVSRTPAADV